MPFRVRKLFSRGITMLISCNGCNSKIRVPESAAGKRVKCPKCATLIRVPEVENSSANAEPESTGVSSKPMPPAPPPLPAEPETQEAADPEAFSETPRSGGSKPPPIKSKHASSVDDDDDDEDGPSKKRRRTYDDDEDDEDEDSDELDVRRRGRVRNKPNNSMAMTSMVMGIVSVTLGTAGSCCCGMIGASIAIACGIMAIIFGIMGKTPGNESMAMTGIICGAVGVVCGVVIFLLGLSWLGLNLGMMR